MGGYGSGRRYGTTVTTTDDVKKIDIRLLQKWGRLPSRQFCGTHWGSLSWSRGEEPAGSSNYEIGRNNLVLRFRYLRASEPWRQVTETVLFDRTRCNYGGERLWFLCPDCGRRIAVLYLGGPRFLCRHCYHLPYASQHESYSDRMMRKARKIRERLGASNNLFEPVWDKPKGMHWNTFERMLEKERIANNQSWVTWVRHFERQ